MVLEEVIILDGIYRLASYIDQVPRDIRREVEEEFKENESLDFYRGVLYGLTKFMQLEDWKENPEAFGPSAYTTVCIAYELVSRGMLEELLH